MDPVTNGAALPFVNVPCKSYGAATIMRVPGRLHIDWADDNTLKMDVDSGTQTRLFHFNSAAAAARSATQMPLAPARSSVRATPFAPCP